MTHVKETSQKQLKIFFHILRTRSVTTSLRSTTTFKRCRTDSSTIDIRRCFRPTCRRKSPFRKPRASAPAFSKWPPPTWIRYKLNKSRYAFKTIFLCFGHTVASAIVCVMTKTELLESCKFHCLHRQIWYDSLIYNDRSLCISSPRKDKQINKRIEITLPLISSPTP